MSSRIPSTPSDSRTSHPTRGTGTGHDPAPVGQGYLATPDRLHAGAEPRAAEGDGRAQQPDSARTPGQGRSGHVGRRPARRGAFGSYGA